MAAETLVCVALSRGSDSGSNSSVSSRLKPATVVRGAPRSNELKAASIMTTEGQAEEAPAAGLPTKEPVCFGRAGISLLRDAEHLAASMQCEESGQKAQLLRGISWKEEAGVLPALRRLLLSPEKERQLINRTVEALLPPLQGPVHKQDPQLLAGKLWLQAKLFALHEKAPIEL
ncbi:hypothetical protein cyc_04957 [Cyclospora cayetanensis]|uniref:ATPTG10-like domain-containing protein n=1 Tax=Cyclospora cayetanensis TaxID=88456 RepID=A0A1D3DAD6_9EIME|nr:hypothetical protein cyc_04957 [Cyclospora cayetanensis]